MKLVYISTNADGEKQRVSFVPGDVLGREFEAYPWAAHDADGLSETDSPLAY